MGDKSGTHLASGNRRNHGYLISCTENRREAGIHVIYRHEGTGRKVLGSGQARDGGEKLRDTGTGLHSELRLIGSESVGVRSKESDGDDHRCTAPELICAGQFPFG
jgi:hypothetical protein